MSKFNTKTQGTKTKNLAGGTAFKENEKLEFVSILLTSFVQAQFYRGASQTTDRVAELIKEMKDKKFTAKAAIYARNEYGMRSISHVVAGELAKLAKGEKWTKNFYDKVVHRVDDTTEILSYYVTKYGKPIPNSLKKGLAKGLLKFDEYQIAKYKVSGKAMSLVDVINLVRPKPTPAIDALMKGTLKAAETWEKKLTQAGQKAETEEQKAELKDEAWKELIKTRKIGYFALLRNLRNIIEQSPEMIDDACKLLTDEKLIKKSLVLPFRYVSALKEVEKLNDSRKVIIALSKAIDISCANIPKFDGKIAIVLDDSGSMTWAEKPIEIGALFAAALLKTNNADLIMFSDRVKYLTLNPTDSILTMQKQIIAKAHGGGTDFRLPFKLMTDKKVKYDRIIILSDMQGWRESTYANPGTVYSAYKKEIGADPILYSFDLAGHGTLQFPERNVYCLAGFSEKVFDIMKLLEEDKNALIDKIEQVEL